MTHAKHRTLFAAIAVALACVLGGGALVAQAVEYWTPKYDWYDGSGSYTLPSSAGGMQALSALVNGTYDPADLPESVRATHTPAAPIDFAGETITLSDAGHPFFTFRDNTWKFSPIGDSAKHAFNGTFDGNGNSVSQLFLNSESATDPCGTQYIGLFGHVGPQGTIKNFTLNDTCAVSVQVTKNTDEAAKQHIAYVGSLVGMCEGSIENCTSYAGVSIVWDDGNSGSARPAENATVIDGVGGIAGYCDGDLSGCVYKGYVDIWTPADAYYDKANAESLPNVVTFVGGIVGRSGGDPLTAGLGEHGDISNCTNEAKVTTTTSGSGGKDRFGETVESKTYALGGIAGYAIGNIANCSNTGDLFGSSYIYDYAASDEDNATGINRADGGASGAGGIVGLCRYGTANYRSADTEQIKAFKDGGVTVDRGIKGKLENGGTADRIEISGCTNLGQVIACDTNGGIAGGAGTYTSIVACVNGDPKKVLADDEVGRVKSTRWNKPCTGGIVGNGRGDISYCRNHSEVLNTKAGYYVGGIVGDSYFYADSSSVPYVKPEVWACYTTGQITTNYGLRRGAVAGGNGGYIHDCLFLYGTSSAGDEEDTVVAIGDDTGRGDGESRNISVAYASEQSAAAYHGMCLKSQDAVAYLNTSAQRDGWTHYYLINTNVNKGYPVLDSEGIEASGAVDLSQLDLEVTLEENARYTSAYNPTPKLHVTANVGGSVVTLAEQADYYVVADEAALDEHGICKGTTTGSPYKAGIHGIGAYSGSIANAVAYGIDRGDFTECTVFAQGATYTGEPQNTPAVEVRDAAGGTVSPADYDVTVNNGEPCVKAGPYSVVATAKNTSNYVGFINGNYQIGKVDIARDCDVVGLIWGNRVWLYDDVKARLYETKPVLDANGNMTYYDAAFGDGSFAGYPRMEGFEQYADSEGRLLTKATPKHVDEDGDTVFGMDVDYTGDEINPYVIGVRWMGKQLVYHDPNHGVYGDYNVHYGGGAGGSEGLGDGEPNIEASTLGSVSVRYASGSYLQNYVVMVFDINPVELDAADVEVTQDFYTLSANDGQAPLGAAAVVSYKGAVIGASNYELVPEYSIDSSGMRHEGEQITYNIGDELYYTVHFKDDASVSCEDIAGKVHFTITDGQVSINDPAIKVAIDDEGLTWQLKGVKNPSVTVTNTSTGAVLEEGRDYTLYWDYEAADPGELALHYHLPRVSIIGQDAYAGTRTETFHIAVGKIVPDNFDPASADYYEQVAIVNGSLDGQWFYNGATKRYERVQNVVSRWEQNADGSYSLMNLQTYRRQLPYIKGGYGATELARTLYLEWRADESYANQLDESSLLFRGVAGKSYGLGGMTVSKIVNKTTGLETERMTEPGTYTLTIIPDTDNPDNAWRMAFAEDFAAELDFEIVPIDLGDKGRDVNGTPPFRSYLTPVALGYHYDNWGEDGKWVSSHVVEEEKSYPYTGQPILPNFQIADYGADLAMNDMKPVDYSAHAITSDMLDIYVDGYGSTGPVETGNDYKVTKLAAREGVAGVTGELNLVSIGWNNVRYSIVPASLSDGTVDIDVETLSYTGAALEPKVRFSIGGTQCTYTEGEDYRLSYTNNLDAGTPEDDNPPTVKITVLNKSHLTAEQTDDEGNPYIEMPFTIKNAPVQMEAVEWELPASVALGEGNEQGTLVECDITGSYTNDDGASVPVPQGAYEVQAGVLADDGSFAPKESDWSEREAIVWRIAATGASGDYQGEVVVVGKSVVAASPLSFSHANEEGYALTVALQSAQVNYCGAQVRPAVTVSANGAELQEGRDYTLASENDVNAAAADAAVAPALILKGRGAYTGTYCTTYAIVPVQLETCEVEVAACAYDGTQHKPAGESVKVKLSGTELAPGDWEIDTAGYGANVDAGQGTLVIESGNSGNTVGAKNASFEIAPAKLSQDSVDVIVQDKPFTGRPIELEAQDLQVTFEGGKSLRFGEDFAVAYPADHTQAGRAQLWINGLGNYRGTLSTSFTITAASLADAQVHVQTGTAVDEQGNSTGDWVYTGKAVEPEVTVELDGQSLVQDDDYTVEYESNVNAGEATVVVVGSGNTKGSAPVAHFTIVPASLDASSARLVQAASAYVYTGQPVTPKLSLLLRGVQVPADEYTLSYLDADGNKMDAPPTVCGSYAAVATASGNSLSEGQVQATFEVVPADLSTCKLKVEAACYAFGQPVEPAATLVTKAGNVVDAAEYTLSYSPASELGAYGSVVATAVAGGNYTGSVGATYQVTKIPISVDDVEVGNGGEYEWTGSTVVPDIRIKVSGHELIEGTDYTLDYLGDAISVGRQTVEILCPESSVYTSNGIVVSYTIAEKKTGETDTKPAEKPAAGTKAVKKAVVINKAAVTAKVVKKVLKAANDPKATTITLGAMVKRIKAKAFKGTTVKTIVLKTKKLTKKSVKNSLKGSKVKTIKVQMTSKKTTKKLVKKYKKAFTKKNCGRAVKVRR